MDSNLTKRLYKSIIFQAVFLITNLLTNFILISLLIFNIGKNLYGIYEIIASFLIFDYLFDLGIGNTVIKYSADYFNKSKEKFNTFIWSLIYLRLFLSFCAFIILVFIAIFFDKIFNNIPKAHLREAQLSAIVFGIGILFKGITSVADNILKGFVRYDLSSFIRSSEKIIGIIFAFIYLHILHLKNLIVVTFFIFTLLPIISGILLFYAVKKIYPDFSFIPVKFSSKIIKELRRYIFGMSFITILAQIYNQGNKLIIGIFLNPVYVGMIAITNRLKLPLSMIKDTILRPLLPAASEIYVKSNKIPKNLIFMLSRYESYLTFFFAGMIVFYIPELSKVWLHNKYPDLPLISQIVISIYLVPSYVSMLMIYYSMGKTKANAIMVSIMSTSSIILGIISIQLWNIYGLVLTTTIINILFNLTGIIYYCYYFKISFWEYIIKSYLRTYITLIITLSLSIIIKHYFVINSWITLFSTVFSTSVLYFLILIILMPKEDLSKIKKILRRN